MPWRVREGCEFVWRTWDHEEFLVYDISSGDTHLVNRVTSETLRALERSALGRSDLSRAVAASLGVASEAGFEANIGNLLLHLERIGLVERVS